MVVLGGAAEEQGTGLPTITGAIELRVMRAHIRRVDSRAFAREQLGETCLHAPVVAVADEAARHSRLVCDDDDGNGGSVERGDRLGGAGAQADELGFGDVVRVVDDGAVTIEKRRAARSGVAHGASWSAAPRATASSASSPTPTVRRSMSNLSSATRPITAGSPSRNRRSSSAALWSKASAIDGMRAVGNAPPPT